jgi:hypothetical protein
MVSTIINDGIFSHFQQLFRRVNMSKLKIYILLITMIWLPTQAWSVQRVKKYICDSEYYVSIEAKASAYIPEEEYIRKMYSNVMGMYELEMDIYLWKKVSGYFSLGYMESEGHFRGVNSHTSLQLIPVTLGMKYAWHCSANLDVYMAAAGVYSWLDIKDRMPAVEQHYSKNGFGGSAKVGAWYFFYNDWFVDIFAEFMYQEFSFKKPVGTPLVNRSRLNLSGYKAGLAIGYAF